MPTKNLGDIRLHYEITGDGEPLLLIHGLGSSARDWENQVGYFADRYRVVTPDVRRFRGERLLPNGSEERVCRQVFECGAFSNPGLWAFHTD